MQIVGVSFLGNHISEIFQSICFISSEHLNGSRHLEIINETKKCLFCEKVIFSEFVDEHQEEFHNESLFKCAFDENCHQWVGLLFY